MPQIAIADLTNMGEMVPNTMTITRISVPPAHWGQGHGSKLLKLICEEADIERVALSLQIHSSGPHSQADLESWYERHGFRETEYWPGVYVRRPQ